LLLGWRHCHSDRLETEKWQVGPQLGSGDVGIVVKDVVVTDLVDDAVESVRVDTYFLPVLIEVSNTPVFEKVVL
jgi:hypothetical protein